ncbi:MAG: 5-histidylcysteine sulfoxide synthase, partial [Candidatus Cloacimonetes bacterium]|nr:5-histidylcysteine sulfoxide synthase [Candidatus Cloacimonadota bacterium]
MKDLVTKTIILNQGDPDSKRKEILEYFRKTVAIEEKLFATFKDEKTYYLRADPLRHPLIFYFGHTAVFYINKLIIAKLISKRINPRFESIFAVGVDEMSWDDLNEEHYDWPDVAEVSNYRKQVWNLVEEKINSLNLRIPINWHEPFWAILMGIEHQRIHLETSSVLIRQLPLSALKQTEFWQKCSQSGEPPENQLIPVTSGKVVLGKNFDDPLYGWDNEFGHMDTQVTGFKAGKYLVSNREFHEFVEENGYQHEEYWPEEGWNWKKYTRAEHPFFWRREESGNYRLRIMLEEIPMPWNWPVIVNFLEAKAFCNWKSKKTGKSIRLPSEAEWYRLRDLHIDTDQPWWGTAPGNINLEHFASSCPVDKFKFGDFYDLIGNVWQWTETPISGFDGFIVHPYYDDFSTPTFDGKHNLIKGGSWISTGNEAVRAARYAFRRHFFQHAGFRYIESDIPVKITARTYEEDTDVTLRCEFNYGEKYFGIDNFPENAAKFCLEIMTNRDKKNALHLGCDVGRASFELAKQFEHVVGLDFTARYIRIAIQMRDQKKILYTLP